MQEGFTLIRPTLKHLESMRELLQPEINSGVILDRPLDVMANMIRSYFVVQKEGKIIGLCALQIHSATLAEIRSLIVAPEFRGMGVGSALIEATQIEAKELGIREILVLTYQRSLFEKLGFSVIEKTQIPNHKIWADCILCKHFPLCDEIALLKNL